MDKKLVYRTTLNHCPLCYQETKRINLLLLEEHEPAVIEGLVAHENILQLPSLDRRRRVGGEALFRLTEAGRDVQELIQKEDLQTSKAMVVYAILKVDRLFQEFARGVYLEKLLTLHREITKRETVRFIERAIEKDVKAQKWSTKTVNELAGTILRVLIEAGWLRKVDSEVYVLEGVAISAQAEKYLRNEGYKPAAEVVLGELL